MHRGWLDISRNRGKKLFAKIDIKNKYKKIKKNTKNSWQSSTIMLIYLKTKQQTKILKNITEELVKSYNKKRTKTTKY